MNVRNLLSCVALLGTLATPVFGQQSEIDAQLKQIFGARDFAPARFGPARWLDGSSYTTVERAAQGGSEIVKYDAPTGTRTIYVSAAQLTPAGSTTPLSIADYIWSADGGKLLIFTNTQRVWRDNTRNLELMMSTVAPTAAFRSLPGDAPLAIGRDSVRAFYGRRLPRWPAGFRVHIGSRIADGAFVIDHEEFSDSTGALPGAATWIYQVTGGLIQHAWVLRQPQPAPR